MFVDNRYISIRVDESKLKERNRDLAFLLEMSNFLSGSLTVEDLLTGALAKVLGYFRLQAGRIYLLEGDCLILKAHMGLQPGGLERVQIQEGFSGKAFRTRSFIAQNVSDLEDGARAKLLLDKGLQVVICVPLIVMEKVGGVMNLAATKRFRLDQRKIDLLTVVGNQISVAADDTLLYQELQKKMATLKERQEMVQLFTLSVTHDLKSPAVGIHGLTRRLKDKYGHVLDKKGREYCDHILKTAEQIVALVDTVKAYVVSREAPLNFERVVLKDLIRQVREEFSPTLKEHGVRWVEPREILEITADRLAMTRVLTNLVDNALKYGGDALSEIRIKYREDGSHHILLISDNGVGIKPEDREKVFGLFHRDDRFKTTHGAGLGLAIVREIAKRHGGETWIEPNTRKGVCFGVSISKELTSNTEPVTQPKNKEDEHA